MPRLLAATAALAALTVVGVGSSATAASGQKAHATVIKMKQDGKDLYFEGPETRRGRLRPEDQEHHRSAAKVGPHTFSLVRRRTSPPSRQRSRPAARSSAAICGAIVNGTTSTFRPATSAVNPVEAGGKGWDKEGSEKVKGDSWVR